MRITAFGRGGFMHWLTSLVRLFPPTVKANDNKMESKGDECWGLKGCINHL